MLELGIIGLLINKMSNLSSISTRSVLIILTTKVIEGQSTYAYSSFNGNFHNSTLVINFTLMLTILAIFIKLLGMHDSLDNQNSIYQLSQL